MDEPNGNINEAMGGVLILLTIVGGGILLISLWLKGAVWGSERLLPWFLLLSRVCLSLVIFIVLPFTIPLKTRGWASFVLLIASYVFGATLWMLGLIVSLAAWGWGVVFFGLFLAGVGVVPIGFVGAIWEGMWDPFIDMTLLIIMTYSTRAGAFKLVKSLGNDLDSDM